MTGGRETWDTEKLRQGQELVTVLNDAIDTYGKRLVEAGRMPMLNAVAAALIVVEAGLIASIADPQYRRLLKEAMDRDRATATATTSGEASVLVVGGTIQ